MKSNSYESKTVKLACALFAIVALIALIGTLFAASLSDAEAAYAFDADTQYFEAAKAETDFTAEGKSSYMLDSATGCVVYAKNELERLPIASMTKIMTALLVLEAVDRGELSLSDDVEVSQEAASMGGSQVFLDAGSVHKAGALLKTVIVASANDSCVALAEKLSGSVGAFVAAMNERAKQLGMENTNFKNCTGLPAAESFSCAKDVSVMFGELIKHPAYFDYSQIWLEDFPHPGGRTTTITNTNKLVRFYKGCDGGKTGFTSEAKFCLAATAKRNDMRLISVIIGASSSKGRFAAVSNMFNYAFNNFENKILLSAGAPLENSVEVLGGKKHDISLTVKNDVAQFMSMNDKASFELKYELPDKVKAPVKAGDTVGKVYLVKDGVEISSTEIVASETVKARNVFDAIRDIGRYWGIVVK